MGLLYVQWRAECEFGYNGGHLITHVCVSIRLAVWSGLLYAWSVFTTNSHRRMKCRNAPFVGFPDAFALLNNIATHTHATVPASRHVWWVKNRATRIFMKLDKGNFTKKSQFHFSFNLDSDGAGDHLRPCNCSGGLSLFFHPGGSGWVPLQSMWDLR
jgi:hypothetical protein